MPRGVGSRARFKGVADRRVWDGDPAGSGQVSLAGLARVALEYGGGCHPPMTAASILTSAGRVVAYGQGIFLGELSWPP
jgi:hypothetical protein